MRNRSLSAIRSLAVTLWLASSVTAADEAPLQIQIADPRPYGYVVGDVLRRSIHVDAPRPWSITSESLPKAGRIDQWLELRDAHRLFLEIGAPIRAAEMAKDLGSATAS